MKPKSRLAIEKEFNRIYGKYPTFNELEQFKAGKSNYTKWLKMLDKKYNIVE